MTNSTKRRLAAYDPSDLTAPSTWMSMMQVCELLDESRSTIDKWRARGTFVTAVRKPNGKLMFRRADVADFIARLEEAA